MRYRLTPVETSIGEGGFAEFKVWNEFDEHVVTFGFPDEHEAHIARALMIRAISRAVLIVGQTSVSRRASYLIGDAEQ
jgi:hypothetical protein